jgi:phosphoglycolate phosphatase-like HAD superfamily hydrolase
MEKVEFRKINGVIYAVVFDYDGTIESTFNIHLKYVSLFLMSKNKLKKEFTADQYRDFHNGVVEAAPGLKDMDWDEYAEYIDPIRTKLIMKPGIKLEFRRLGNKYNSFISTAGHPDSIKKYLKHNDIDHFVKIIFGYGDGLTKSDRFKHLFKMGILSKNIIFLTDTLGDIIEAHKVGVKTIALYTPGENYSTLENIRKGDPYKIVESDDFVTTFCKACVLVDEYFGLAS